MLKNDVFSHFFYQNGQSPTNSYVKDTVFHNNFLPLVFVEKGFSQKHGGIKF